MRELQLDSLHADGEHVILVDADGTRFRLAIDEPLRLAVRRDRPQLEALRAREASSLRPRDIQARLRAGASAAEVADEGGLSVEAVRRYEGPVRDEQAWIVEQTQAMQIGREVGAPTLGDLVLDRLATRGAPSHVEWDAVRSGGQPWEVSVRFQLDGTAQRAAWHVDLQARSITALDEESRWLSETDLTVRKQRPFDVEADGPGRGSDVVVKPGGQPDSPIPAGTAAVRGRTADVSTDVLLERLAAARGRRRAKHAPDAPAEGEESGTDESASIEEMDEALFPVAPVLRLRSEADDAEPAVEEAEPSPDEPEAEPEAPQRAASGAARKKGRRTSVPSWDEIVFGARGD